MAAGFVCYGSQRGAVWLPYFLCFAAMVFIARPRSTVRVGLCAVNGTKRCRVYCSTTQHLGAAPCMDILYNYQGVPGLLHSLIRASSGQPGPFLKIELGVTFA